MWGNGLGPPSVLEGLQAGREGGGGGGRWWVSWSVENKLWHPVFKVGEWARAAFKRGGTRLWVVGGKRWGDPETRRWTMGVG